MWERPLSVQDVMRTPLRSQIPVLRWICRVTFLLGTKMPNPHQSSGRARKTGKHMNHFKAKVTQDLDRTAVERREQRSGPAMAAGSSARLEASESGLLCPLRVLGPAGEAPWKTALSVSSPPPCVPPGWQVVPQLFLEGRCLSDSLSQVTSRSLGLRELLPQ